MIANEKQKGYGTAAINNLADNNLITKPEEHLVDLDGYMPSWKVWVLLNNLFEALKPE